MSSGTTSFLRNLAISPWGEWASVFWRLPAGVSKPPKRRAALVSSTSAVP